MPGDLNPPQFVPLSTWREYPPEEMRRRAASFARDLSRRRSIRMFSDRPVPREIIADCLRAAGTAPSGANLQPWHFVAVSDPAVKQRIREAAEREEYEFYHHRAPPEWLEALAPLGTDEHKPYLVTAPWLIAVFGQRYGTLPDGRRVTHYYVSESVGIACGFLLAAVHHAGLCALTHTPSPMGFLNDVLGRPASERAFPLMVVGYPAEGAGVPRIGKKALGEITTFLDPAHDIS